MSSSIFNDAAGNDAASWAGSTILSQLLVTQGGGQLESVPALYLQDFHDSPRAEKAEPCLLCLCMRNRIPGAAIPAQVCRPALTVVPQLKTPCYMSFLEQMTQAGGSPDPHSLCVFLGIGLEPCPIPTSHNAPGLHIKWCGCLTSPVHSRKSLPVTLIHSCLTLWA